MGGFALGAFMDKDKHHRFWSRPVTIGLLILALTVIGIAGFGLLRSGKNAKPAAPCDLTAIRPLSNVASLKSADARKNPVPVAEPVAEVKAQGSSKSLAEPLTIGATAPVPAPAPNPLVVNPPKATVAQPKTESEIISYLRSPPAFALDYGAEYNRRNELMHALRVQAHDRREVTELLLGVYRDKAQGEVLQSYALQHLSLWAQDKKTGSADRELAIAALREAASAWSTEFLGGAGLLGLKDAAGAEAAQPALDALASPESSVNSRISSFQVCAQLGEQGALPFAEQTATDGQANFVLRMSAVAALAALGGRDAEPVLKTLAQDRERHVSRAAELALARLDRKP